ncbi:MAG: sarcosine oxidase subunit gamma SoxG, partial [Desulfobulbaceae bacterium]|nr:sarcosine oxidase subunit gamma SoxG [Desulfobulbaceae bacterium]
MNEVRRHSPVSFELQPVQTEARGHWSVALKYPHEGEGPHLVDLSHKPKWDVQSSAIDTIQPFGVEIPKA